MVKWEHDCWENTHVELVSTHSSCFPYHVPLHLPCALASSTVYHPTQREFLQRYMSIGQWYVKTRYFCRHLILHGAILTIQVSCMHYGSGLVFPQMLFLNPLLCTLQLQRSRFLPDALRIKEVTQRLMPHQTSLLVSIIPLGLCQDHIFTVLPLAGASYHRFVTITPCAVHS
ncbi:hypothetical protein BJ165DRAFT_556076 [Panaeolus papilionaceus]|nr:hypothetical protein BJ165DRAFT_556076 [Panaeolus papilionaceus]